MTFVISLQKYFTTEQNSLMFEKHNSLICLSNQSNAVIKLVTTGLHHMIFSAVQCSF